jgi:YfiH family protein
VNDVAGPVVLRHDETVGRVRFAVTTGLDLADSAVDRVRARELVTTAVGADHLVLARQVHSDRVVVVDGPWADGPAEADGLVVRAPGTAVGVLAADCMPLLLGDPEQGLAAAVHVGRRGLHAGITGAAVSVLVDLGATSLVARLGPTVCGACYEVPVDMRDEVAGAVPAAAATSSRGTPSIDIVAGVLSQLAHAADEHELPVAPDTSWAACTVEDPRSFSHRRDAPTGRHAGVVVVTGPS